MAQVKKKSAPSNLRVELERARAEVRQRTAELAILNSVQHALASQLDLQAIFDLVGDKLREIFDAQVVTIVTLNPGDPLIYPRYLIENGQRLYPAPYLPSRFSQRLIETRESILVRTREEFQALGAVTTPGTADVQSGIYVSLLIGGELRGGLSIQNIDRANAFDEADVRLLETLANSLSVALENARLFDELQTRHREITEALEQQTATSEILRVIARSPSDVEPVMDVIAENARRLLDGLLGGVYRVEGGQIDEVGTSNYSSEGLREHDRSYPRPLAYDSSISSRAILDRAVVTVPDILGDPSLPELTHRYARVMGMNSVVVVPMMRDGEAIGSIAVGRREKGAFTAKQIALLQTFADQAVIAIENVRLFNETKRLLAETQQHAAELEIINSVQAGLASKLELQAIYDLVGDKIRDIFDLQGVLIATFDVANEIEIFHYNYEEGRHFHSAPRKYDATRKKLIASRQPILVNRVTPEFLAEIGGQPVAGTALPKAGIFAPMIVGQEVKGYVSIQNVDHFDAFDESDVRLLQTLTNAMSVALENARLFSETQQHAAELEIINSMGDALAGQIDLDALIQLVGDKLRATFDADVVYIALLDRARAQIDFPYYSDHGKPRTDPPLKFGQGLTSKIIETREPLLLNQDIEQRRAELGVVRQGAPARSYLGVPIIIGEQAIGVISLQSTARENQFDSADLRLLTTIAAGVGIAIDKARLYREIQQRRQYFEGIVQNSPVAIVTFDLDSRIVSWNPAAEKLFGYAEAEAIGRDINDMIAFSDEIRAEATACTLRASRGEASAYITRRHRRDGSLVDVQMWALPVFVGDERVGAIALYNDISALQRARREAESANQAKSAFLATMSHEIRTPMNAVIGMSNLLLGTPLNDEQREYADIIRNSGDALLTIINDILDFSKIEAGKMELEYQPFDLRECVESALDLVTPRANEKQIDLAYEIADDVPAAIIGDAARLRQILLNLLSNAIKFTEKGEIVISVQYSVNSNEQTEYRTLNTVHFAVRDTGIGITPAQMPRLFQSFSQADASTSRKYGGTGLGLAISKRLAELMGGTMRAESAGAGQGATFIFSIRAEPAKILPKAGPTRAYPMGEQPQLRGKRVLIVDDNATNRRILARQLQLWGMTTTDFASPQEALAQFERGEKFDVAILDWQMPAMDGIMLACEIRKIETAHNAGEPTPLILFSSLGRRELNADDVQFAAQLQKPLKPSLLFDTLAGLFVRDAAPTKATPSAPNIDATMAVRIPLRILLAEDNAVNQKLALRILSQMGYRADVAGNGIEAIEAVARQKYDVILMDVQMPEMDGLEATRRIVAQAQERPRIIAMTANATQDDRAMCLAAGMDDYLAKPIRVDELVNALVRAGNRNG